MPPRPPARLDRYPLPLAALFYAAALGTVLLPSLAVAPAGERLIWGVYAFTVLLYGLLTLLLLHQRPDDRRAVLFMFLGLMVSLTLLFNAADVTVGARWTSDLMVLAYCGVYLVTPALAVHMAASIPRPHPLTRRNPWLVPALYGACAAAAVLMFVLLLNTGYRFLPWSAGLQGVQRVLTRINWWSLLLSSWGGLVLLSDAARRAASPLERRQALVVFAGLLPYALNTLVSVAFPRANASPAGQVAEAAVIALVPASFAIAILGHRLFQVGTLVRRGLVFGLTVGVLAAAGYLAAAILEETAHALFGLSLTRWGAAALFLVGGALFQPLSRVVAAQVDRRFFPERGALDALLRTVIPELAGYTEVHAAAAHLTRRVRDALEVETASLLMADAHGEWFRPLGWAGRFPDGDPRHLAVPAREVAPWNDRLAAALPPPGFDGDPAAAPPALARLRPAYAVPIRLRDRLIGLLVLGPPLHGRELERDALETLDGIALQASAMLENARLFALATRDPLTGLLRRQAALDRLAEEVERCRRTFHPFAVAMADLDHFKDVNDGWGHPAGDAVLREVAAVFGACSRRTDLVARYGGEEFLFLLPDTPPQGARVHAEALRARVERTAVRVGEGAGTTVRMTLSIGVCAVGSPELLADPDELVRRADEALYRAKRAGRNRTEEAAPPPLVPASAAAAAE